MKLGPNDTAENGIYLGDALELMQRLPAESVDLVFVDPPYNIGVFCKMPDDEYIGWCSCWIRECNRVLKPNGAFWVSHKNPAILGQLSCEIEWLGRKRINWVTWDKYNSAGKLQGFLDGYTLVDGLRSFQVMAEYLIYHAGNGVGWEVQEYLDGERRRAGVKFEQVRKMVGCAAGSGLPSHWFTRSQWALPTAANYAKLQEGFNTNGNEYLRREYEDLRYTFNNPGKVSSVWQIPPAAKNGHPTPKPMALLDRIILTTTNEWDVVLDPMCGSGTTCKSARDLGRRWVGFDRDKQWITLARSRMDAPTQSELEL